MFKPLQRFFFSNWWYYLAFSTGMASLRFTWPILEPKKKLVNMRLVEIFTRGSLFLWLVRGEKDLLMFCSIKPFFFPFVFSRFYITGSDGEILSGSKNSVSSYHTWVFETTFPLSWRVADIDNYVHRRSKYKRTFQLLDWENSLEVWSPLDHTKSKTAP